MHSETEGYLLHYSKMTKTSNTLVMILAKVPELGKCKTRLAATIGDEKALTVYVELLQHTYRIADKAAADKVVFFTGPAHEFDMLDYYRFDKRMQEGDSLGERMAHCFRYAFLAGYERALIMGSDCHQLDEEIVTEAVEALDANDFVIGPAEDGGYYLIGMKQMHEEIFQDKKWSTADVFLDTLIDMKATGLPYHLLPTLSDVDTEADLDEELKRLIS